MISHRMLPVIWDAKCYNLSRDHSQTTHVIVNVNSIRNLVDWSQILHTVHFNKISIYHHHGGNRNHHITVFSHKVTQIIKRLKVPWIEKQKFFMTWTIWRNHILVYFASGTSITLWSTNMSTAVLIRAQVQHRYMT